MSTPRILNKQRSNNYWEPIFEPGCAEYEDWAPDEKTESSVSAIHNVRFNIERFTKKPWYIDLSYLKVDFYGAIDGGRRKITLKNFTFDRCSFSGCIFENIKFTNCTFEMTSFSLSKFSNCEFRGCQFINIWISGNTTTFSDVYIEVDKLLHNVFLFSDKDVLREHKTNVRYQKYRLEQTKSVVARKLLLMNPIRSDLDAFMVAIKEARRFECISKIEEAKFVIIHGSNRKRIVMAINLLYFSLEYITVFIFGWLSGWGLQFGKTVALGLAAVVFYSFIYSRDFMLGLNLGESIQRSIEYLLLFGYTKYSFNGLNEFQVWVILSNSIIGMIWFAALIPIIINKLSQRDE